MALVLILNWNKLRIHARPRHELYTQSIMKTSPISMAVTLLIFLAGIAPSQERSGGNPPESNPSIRKLDYFNGLDSSVRLITDQEVKEFCDLFRSLPILLDTLEDERVSYSKVRAARGLYVKCKNPEQKKKIVEVMMEMFPLIQNMRDKLGVNPRSKTESYLYVDPPSPPIPNGLSPVERMAEAQKRSGERMTHQNRIASQISALNNLHGYLHRTLTKQMKVPVNDIPFELERSPTEKARTKEMLEKQAAEHEQFPPKKQELAPPTPSVHRE